MAALIGGHGFLTDQGDVTLITKIAQFGGQGCTGLTGADNDDVGHGLIHSGCGFASRVARQAQGLNRFNGSIPGMWIETLSFRSKPDKLSFEHI